MRPKLETLILNHRAKYFNKEKPELVEARTAVLQTAYTHFKKTLRAQDWMYLPDAKLLRMRPQFKQHVYAQEEHNISVDDFSEAFEGLFEKLTAEREDLVNGVKQLSSTATHLAVCVFRRGYHGPILFSVDDVLRTAATEFSWSDYPITASDIHYRCSLVTLASRIVELVGLDPQTATHRDMDTLGKEFTCKRCSVRGQPQIVYCWRGAVRNI
jgi:hypothetical protein